MTRGNMTREEAKNEMIKAKKTYMDLHTSRELKTERCKSRLSAYDIAIKALEQEPIIDKIRAEISEAMDMEPAWKGQDNYIGGLQIACSIIDKYRQEG